ncbi:MAG: hypothetical protein AB7O57_00015 [Hyphomicrobiaceae bacterium]
MSKTRTPPEHDGELGPPTPSEQLLAYLLVSFSSALVGFLIGWML